MTNSLTQFSVGQLKFGLRYWWRKRHLSKTPHSLNPIVRDYVKAIRHKRNHP